MWSMINQLCRQCMGKLRDLKYERSHSITPHIIRNILPHDSTTLMGNWQVLTLHTYSWVGRCTVLKIGRCPQCGSFHIGALHAIYLNFYSFHIGALKLHVISLNTGISHLIVSMQRIWFLLCNQCKHGAYDATTSRKPVFIKMQSIDAICDTSKCEYELQ
jgi:hypothetical protein